MKKIMIIIAVASVANLMLRYANECEGAVHIVLKGATLNMAKMMMPKEARNVFSELGVSQMEICDLSSCSSSTKDSFAEEARKTLKEEGFVLVKAEDNAFPDTEAWIVKQDGGTVDRLAVISATETYCWLYLMYCR